MDQLSRVINSVMTAMGPKLEPEQLQSLLGHSSLDTTMIYARVDMTDVLSSYNRCF